MNEWDNTRHIPATATGTKHSRHVQDWWGFFPYYRMTILTPFIRLNKIIQCAKAKPQDCSPRTLSNLIFLFYCLHTVSNTQEQNIASIILSQSWLASFTEEWMEADCADSGHDGLLPMTIPSLSLGTHDQTMPTEELSGETQRTGWTNLLQEILLGTFRTWCCPLQGDDNSTQGALLIQFPAVSRLLRDLKVIITLKYSGTGS